MSRDLSDLDTDFESDLELEENTQEKKPKGTMICISSDDELMVGNKSVLPSTCEDSGDPKVVDHELCDIVEKSVDNPCSTHVVLFTS